MAKHQQVSKEPHKALSATLNLMRESFQSRQATNGPDAEPLKCELGIKNNSTRARVEHRFGLLPVRSPIHAFFFHNPETARVNYTT